jgi:hypothetical protein
MKKVNVTPVVLMVIMLFASMAFAANDPLKVTIYNDNRALVNEHRVIQLKRGLNEISLTDVSARIDPTSVHVASLTDPEGTRVLEQNFEYDLVSTDRLLEKYPDRQIRAVTSDGAVYKGRLMGTAGGLIIQNSIGGITVLQKERLREITFPSLPNGLITRPTLRWLIDAATGGKHETELAYITGGLNWHADYVLSLSKDDANADLDGWVTLDNKSGMTFEDAHTKLVAGSLHRAPSPPGVMLEQAVRREAAAAKQPQVQQRALFEYHLYDVKRPLTIQNNQTKQIQFVSCHRIPVKKRFVLDSGSSYARGNDNREKGKAEIQVRFVNDQKSGLGIPLPAGVCRLYKSDVDDSKQLIGEDRVDHTPKDETITLTAGQAFDVVGERVKTSQEVLGKRSRKETWHVEVTNHKQEKISVHVLERLNPWGESEILSESRPHIPKTADTIEYLAEVPEGGKSDITYTVIYRW